MASFRTILARTLPLSLAVLSAPAHQTHAAGDKDNGMPDWNIMMDTMKNFNFDTAAPFITTVGFGGLSGFACCTVVRSDVILEVII